jgi:tRNA pseudouridine55 synthase
MEGILIVNKPSGMTSFDVVDFVRRRLRIKKVGHTGTLDPLASGVLILLLGRATKFFKSFERMDKEYVAKIRLGIETDTGDSDGKILREASYEHVTEEMVKKVFGEFSGEIYQIPPMVSAIRSGGKRLYELARRGIEIKRQPRKVRIEELKLIRFSSGEIEFYLRCSKGTYVRVLAQDIGRRLGCFGHICQIERTAVGPFRIEEAISLEKIDASHIRHIQI